VNKQNLLEENKMGFFSFLGTDNSAADEEKAKIEKEKKTVKDWVPVKDVKDGIIHLKNGMYIKILEIIPVNFKLKSRAEKKMLLYNYRSFLKGCKFPMQISIQCRKANIEPHIDRMKQFLEVEKNINVRNMINGYIKLVSEIGLQGTITRRYYIIYSYIAPYGVANSGYNDVLKQMKDKQMLIKDYLTACGNEVIENCDTEFQINVLYSYLNKKTCEVQKIGKKLLTLMGTFLESSEDYVNKSFDDDEEDD
jgi:hypothetical protein